MSVLRRNEMFDSYQRDSWGPSPGGSQPFGPAHEEFQAHLQQAWPSPDVAQAVAEAFAAYSSIVQEPWGSPELQRRAAEAYAVYAGRIQQAFAHGRADHVTGAYRRYVQHLKRVWAAVDPDSLSPADLGAIAQGMSWVAGVAHGVAPGANPIDDPRSQP
jgi:hypothetical protein